MESATKRLLGAATTVLLASAASAQATFQSFSPNGASRMTPEGQTIVGANNTGPWLWTAGGGFTTIGASGTMAVDLSDDAAVVVGNKKDALNFDGPAMWDAVNGWVTLGGLPGQTPPSNSYGTASAVSGDGSIVVGLGWLSNFKARGFRWDAVQGMVQMPQLGTRSSRALAISGNGQMIGGWDEHDTGVRRAAVWDANLNETLFLARPENPEGYGEISDFNSDGTVIAGHDYIGNNPKAGFVWTASKGVINFGPVPGVNPIDNYNWANGVSEDGSVAVGGNWDLSINTTFATIWTEATGVMFLKEHLMSLGVQGLDNIQLANALDISADGTIIQGWGAQGFAQFWFIATLPSCNGGTASFCITSPNSAGSGALIGSNNQTSIASNAFELSATGLPASVNGIFFYGPQAQQVPFGNGVNCVGSGGIGTFRLPMYTSDASGSVLQLLDFNQLPAGGEITPGSTWNFQAWYRDPAAGGAMFNTSDALRATFCD